MLRGAKQNEWMIEIVVNVNIVVDKLVITV